MAPKRKLDDEDGDVSAGSAGEEKQDGAATEADTPVKKGRGRPRKADSDKKPYTPTGNPRGRPRTKIPGADMRKKRGRPSLSSKFGTDSSDGEDSPPASRKKRGRPRLAPKSGTDKDVNIVSTNQPRKRGRPLGSSKQQKGDKAAKKSSYIPTGKPRGRRPLGKNGAKKTTPYIPTGKPRGRRPLGENGAKKTTPYIPTGKPRGRRPLGENGAKKTTPYIPTGKPRGRKPKIDKAIKIEYESD